MISRRSPICACISLIVLVVIGSVACTDDDSLVIEAVEPVQSLSALRFRDHDLSDPPMPRFLGDCNTSADNTYFIMRLQDTLVAGIGSAHVLYDDPELRPYLGLIVQAKSCLFTASIAFFQLNVELDTAAGPRRAINPSGRCQESNGQRAPDPEPSVALSGRSSFRYDDDDNVLNHYLPDTSMAYAPTIVIDSYDPIDSLYRGRFVGRFIKDTLCYNDPLGNPDTVIIEEGWFKVRLER